MILSLSLSGYQSEVFRNLVGQALWEFDKSIFPGLFFKVDFKSGFLLPRQHMGRDLGFSSITRIIPTKSGWLESLWRQNNCRKVTTISEHFFTRTINNPLKNMANHPTASSRFCWLKAETRATAQCATFYSLLCDHRFPFFCVMWYGNHMTQNNNKLYWYFASRNTKSWQAVLGWQYCSCDEILLLDWHRT